MTLFDAVRKIEELEERVEVLERQLTSTLELMNRFVDVFGAKQ